MKTEYILGIVAGLVVLILILFLFFYGPIPVNAQDVPEDLKAYEHCQNNTYLAREYYWFNSTGYASNVTQFLQCKYGCEVDWGCNPSPLVRQLIIITVFGIFFYLVIKVLK